ncbi:hypothetical protein [Sulfurovum sp. NBC37-1]|uniref:hypothetical protein n=1 Tax=Sulfurovum sp. (strain NBC37-1) TaxID=387093 RepID=UPI0001587AAB|nr:hypothetical protein [Sulfurovum sp. NBC37-1]BAF73019.1 conserved hypothetical protein [Sulfurovum sp. NBC37-1]
MSIENLLVNRVLLEKQLFWLEHSFEETTKIGLKPSYEVDEFDSYENLCSRFGRMIDFLVRKMFRAIDAVEFENQGTLIDTVNNAHKRGLFENIETIREIKDLRNAIAHEYIDDYLQELFEDIMKLTPDLIELAKITLKYTEQYQK